VAIFTLVYKKQPCERKQIIIISKQTKDELFEVIARQLVFFTTGGVN